MKKLKKLHLKDAKIMTAPQMKHIFGGYNENGGGYSGGYGDCISWEDNDWCYVNGECIFVCCTNDSSVCSQFGGHCH